MVAERFELGSVSSGETVEVRANGSKVVVGNGEIDVLEPTSTGQKIDTKFKVVSTSAGFYIEVSGTEEADFLHYLTNESWSRPSDYAEVDANGDQFVYAPGASAGSTARMKRMPIEVEPAVGDVHVTVEDANHSNPRLDVDPGDAAGDDVDFVYHDTTAGETYILDSVTFDVVRDSAEANSPVTLSDDDSDEDLEIYKESDDSSSSGGGGDLPGSGSGGPGSVVEESEPIANPILVLIVAVGLLAAIGVGANRFFEDRVITLGVISGAGLLEAFVVSEVLFPGVFTIPASQGVRRVIPAIAFSVAIVVLWLLWRYVNDEVLDDDETVRGRAVRIVEVREEK